MAHWGGGRNGSLIPRDLDGDHGFGRPPHPLGEPGRDTCGADSAKCSIVTLPALVMWGSSNCSTGIVVIRSAKESYHSIERTAVVCRWSTAGRRS